MPTSYAGSDNDWSKDSLLAKAQRFAEMMVEQDREKWTFPFWSALTLEVLARATLANISPALLADGKDWTNVYYALVGPPPVKKFVPKSEGIVEILTRIEVILPEFNKEMLNFSVSHVSRRNADLHSGALAFDGMSSSEWLPMFYATCQVLLKSLGEDLELLFGEGEAQAAAEMIQASKDDTAKQVSQSINAHKTVWLSKRSDERDALAAQATTLASRSLGHRVACPACMSPALLHGTPAGAANKKLEQDVIVEKQPMLPSHFECFACGLKIAGYSRLAACGLGNVFNATSRYDAAEYFGVDVSEDESGWEPDFNE
jgi:hypothetical protein